MNPTPAMNRSPIRCRRPRSARAFGLLGGAAAVIALLVAAAPAAPASAAGRPPPKYYLALGDSLAVGVQPATSPLPPGASLEPNTATDQGYADDLFAHYSAQIPNLHLVKLGCSGETTTSMLTGAGSPCTYPEGSQLQAALAFIRAERSSVALITIDIGNNNVGGCAPGGVIDQTCLADGFAAAQNDVPQILGALRAAAGEDTVIVGMNTYDPFLATYLAPGGQTLAAESVDVSVPFNSLLDASFGAYGIPVADIQTAFSATDFTDTATLPDVGTVPLNVARICSWTWMCAPSPMGPNVHANQAGYQVIASAFEQVTGNLG